MWKGLACGFEVVVEVERSQVEVSSGKGCGRVWVVIGYVAGGGVGGGPHTAVGREDCWRRGGSRRRWGGLWAVSASGRLTVCSPALLTRHYSAPVNLSQA